jgi:serine/threonine-protein kinase PpkA
MVILPKNSITTDANGKALSIPFAAAIGQHEVTFQQYDAFAIKTGRYLPRDFNWGRGNRPVVDVSYEDASAYASWLSEQTQQRYRLPTQQEWEFAYRAGQTSPFWWGVNKTANNANCRRGCNSQYSKLFSSSTAPVSVYPANGYGLYDTAGNVAEWVNACQQWQDKTQNNCLKTLVAGGSHTDSIANIAAYSSEAKNTSDKTNNIGFRLLLEL